MAADMYGLLIDPSGPFDLTPDYAADMAVDPTMLNGLPSTDPNYLPDIDDETADNATPISHIQKKYRIRFRHYRIKVKNNVDPTTWRDMINQMQGTSVDNIINEMNSAYQNYLIAHWITM